ncbi:MAG TPA: endonuclease III, partial [Guyparkeria sp.]|nr:endonuclease III [Guyparkeria sp.]
MNPRTRREMFARFKRQRPEPTTELEYASPFELLVAVVLSAQATDVGVNRATRPLFKRANTPQAILDLGLDELTEAIRTIGLYRTKAKNVYALSQLLIDKHGGEVPDSRAALEALPGVGRKTANVVLNTL